MRNVMLACVAIATLISCKSKTTLDPEEAKYVRTALDLIRVRADFDIVIASRKSDTIAKPQTPIGADRFKFSALRLPGGSVIPEDSIRFNASLDSVYLRDGISRQQFIDWTIQLADDPKRAAAFYGVLNDSMSGK
jgi:hypothetical protein